MDDSFKAQLLADPVATLKAEGIHVPAGARVSVIEQKMDEKEWHIVLPPKPQDLEDQGVIILRHSNLSTTQRYLGKVSDMEAMRWIDHIHG